MTEEYSTSAIERAVQDGLKSSLVVTLHSNVGKYAFGSKYCTQFPELAELFVLKSRTETDASKKGLCCINSVGRSSSVARFKSGSDNEDVEQLVYEAHLVFDMGLTREAMSSADHPHHLEALHRSGGRLHCLKASRGANDSLQCAVVRFNDVVQILARAMLGIA